MVSHKHKFIYIHIPKAAGTSIENALYRLASQSSGSDWARREKVYRNKELFDLIKTHEKYFTFTFVRNPYSKLVSLYHFYNYYRSIKFKNFLMRVFRFLELNPEKIYKKIPFNQTKLKFNQPSFVDYLPQIPKYPFNDTGNAGYHFLPQTYFISDDVDYIGRFENIKEDFKFVCNKIKINTKELPHINKTNHKHYSEYYNEETRQIVSELYKEDIKRFGYQFEEK